MINVTLETFQSDVVEASANTAILLDFWAPWCGPCKSLTPILEKLEQEFGGAFTLAKVNSDEQQQIAAAFQIRSIPTCVLFVQGQPVDGFSGALPEGQVKEMLLKHIQPKQTVPAQVQLLIQARQASEAADFDTAFKLTREALSIDPQYEDARLDLADLLLDGNPVAAQTELAKVNTKLLDEELSQVYHALSAAVQERLAQAAAALDSPEIVALKAHIANTPKDLQARLDLANAYKTNKTYELALEQLLYIVQTDRSFGDDIGRKGMIEVFGLAGDTPDMVRVWRQKLSTALY